MVDGYAVIALAAAVKWRERQKRFQGYYPEGTACGQYGRRGAGLAQGRVAMKPSQSAKGMGLAPLLMTMMTAGLSAELKSASQDSHHAVDATAKQARSEPTTQ